MSNVGQNGHRLRCEVEYHYSIKSVDKVSVKKRVIYKSLGEGSTSLPTRISQTVSGKADTDSFRYRDSDGRSNENPFTVNGKPINFDYSVKAENFTFGLPDIDNYENRLEGNDFYWIEIEADFQGFAKREGKACKLNFISFGSMHQDNAVFQIRVPFAGEGILRSKRTMVKNVSPSPSNVYDELEWKVFQWNLGERLSGQKDGFEVIFEVKSNWSPLSKYLVSGIVGAAIGTILTIAASCISRFL
jgi:hypothetical protein